MFLSSSRSNFVLSVKSITNLLRNTAQILKTAIKQGLIWRNSFLIWQYKQTLGREITPCLLLQFNTKDSNKNTNISNDGYNLTKLLEKKVFEIADYISPNVSRKPTCSGNIWICFNPTSLYMSMHILCFYEDHTTIFGMK